MAEGREFAKRLEEDLLVCICIFAVIFRCRGGEVGNGVAPRGGAEER